MSFSKNCFVFELSKLQNVSIRRNKHLHGNIICYILYHTTAYHMPYAALTYCLILYDY